MRTNKIFWWGNEVIHYRLILPTTSTGFPNLYHISESGVTLMTPYDEAKRIIELLLARGYSEVQTRTAHVLGLDITCADGSK